MRHWTIKAAVDSSDSRFSVGSQHRFAVHIEPDGDEGIITFSVVRREMDNGSDYRLWGWVGEDPSDRAKAAGHFSTVSGKGRLDEVLVMADLSP